MPVSNQFLEGLFPSTQPQQPQLASVQMPEALSSPNIQSPIETPISTNIGYHGPNAPSFAELAPPPPAPNASFQPGTSAPMSSIQETPIKPPPAPDMTHGGAGAPSLNSGITMVRGGTVPAHEVATMGPKAMAHLDNALEAQQTANQKVASIQETAAAHQAVAAQVAKEQAEAQMAGARAAQLDEQKRTQAAADKVTQASAGLDKPIGDFWSDKSVGSKVGLALAAMLGQAGVGIAGKGQANPVMGFIQSQMDQDVKTKQLNFQRGIEKKNAAQQDFNNLAHQIGLAPASDVYAGALKAKIAAMAQQEAAVAKQPEIAANATQAAAGLYADSEKHKAEATKLIAAQVKQPTYALPGNPIPVAANTAFGALEKRGEQAAERETKYDIASIAKQGKTDEGTKFIAEKAQAAGIPQAMAAIDAAGQTNKSDNGVGVIGRAVKGATGTLGYNATYGPEATKREQDWTMMKQQVMHALTGAGMGPEERETYNTMLEGAGDKESRSHAITRAREAMQQSIQNIAAGAGSEAWERYKQNKSAVSPKKIDETPVK